MISSGVVPFTSAPQVDRSPFERGTIVLQGHPPQTLEVELAKSQSAMYQGMMHRTEWDDIEGMLFVFGDAAVRGFWMHNTLLSLDMVFFDEEGQLVHIAEHATPESDDLVSSLLPAQYVLELPAGDAKRRGLGDETRLDISTVYGE